MCWAFYISSVNRFRVHQGKALTTPARPSTEDTPTSPLATTFNTELSAAAYGRRSKRVAETESARSCPRALFPSYTYLYYPQTSRLQHLSSNPIPSITTASSHTAPVMSCCGHESDAAPTGYHGSHAHAPQDSSPSDVCCSASHKHGEEKDSIVHSHAARDDCERGAGSFDRVTLIVKGLKCGCCESGLSKAFHHIPAIKNHQVNIVMARVEFDLNTSELSIPEAIARLQKDTGYSFELLDHPEGQVLELLVRDPSDICRTPKPSGVTLLETKNKQVWNPVRLFSGRNTPLPSEPPSLVESTRTSQQFFPPEEKKAPSSMFLQIVRVHYDARQIGARTVYEYYQQHAPSQDVKLAPVGPHPSMSVGSLQTKRASFLFLITLLFTLPILVFAWGDFTKDRLVYAHVSLALATVVQAIATKEFVPGALQSLIHSGVFEMDFLISMSTTTAYIFSLVSYVFLVKHKPLETGSFFETSTLLVTLILLGRAVNEFARFRAAKSVSIRSLQANHALLVPLGGRIGPPSATRKIDARLLQYGDHFQVPPHTRIVTDGDVVYGGSEVDESMITGEPLPVAKGLGHKVHAGTMNGAGQLVVRVTRLPHENSISRIAAMVENAELSKPKVQALADKIAGWFVPAIAVIGLMVFLIWLFVDRYSNGRGWGSAVVRALTYAIATLIVSCPCAIGLAVPMVILIAGGSSARFGIIFRDPQKLEVARNTTDIVFDKTGTLTKAELEVIEGQFHGGHTERTKGMILGLLENDKHPVAMAVLQWLKKEEEGSADGTEPVTEVRMIDIQSVPGSGVKGISEDDKLEVYAGNPQWVGVEVLETQHTVLCVTVSGALAATFRLVDRPRQGAFHVIKMIKERGIRVHMISGDGEGAVDQIAHLLEIPKIQTRWRYKPEDKQRYIHELQKEGKTVCFCGDGTNDSAALKQADVGVHMNSGSDAAKSASDVVLMKTYLHNILILLDISRAAYRRIIANFSWSAIYNVLAITMASGAFIKVRIEPAYAGLGELVSVLPVILIAFQMKWRDYGRKYRSLEHS
ncbi:heavy metal translocatin [Sporormia fimetaria CBS 119925]|uniref:Heavy metal translocatin n=1 Tax=Sporormia fimetaria CBS 119925 TaxID=1340428 RepID=A0A6A6VJV0_9PLEO|nr:heavy metal translocatin [Sporormia fimetaria CBS 119925]